jgi:hypothetical protein
MKSENKNEYPKMVFLTYSNFHFEISQQDKKLLKIIFLRLFQKIKSGIFYLKNSKLHIRSAGA